MVLDLIIINMSEFDVTLDMDFLCRYGAKMDNNKKKVRFSMDNGKQFIFGEDQTLSMMINNSNAKKMLHK